VITEADLQKFVSMNKNDDFSTGRKRKSVQNNKNNPGKSKVQRSCITQTTEQPDEILSIVTRDSSPQGNPTNVHAKECPVTPREEGLQSNMANCNAIFSDFRKCSCADCAGESSCVATVSPLDSVSNDSTTDPKYDLSDVVGDLQQRMHHTMMQDTRRLRENRSLHGRHSQLLEQVYVSHAEYKKFKRILFMLANEGFIDANPEDELSIDGIGEKLVPKPLLQPPPDLDHPNYELQWNQFRQEIDKQNREIKVELNGLEDRANHWKDRKETEQRRISAYLGLDN
jgi:hypothetical protein